MTTTRTQRIVTALARIPRSGSLHNDLHDEAAVLVKELPPILVDQRLGAVIRALLLLAAEYSAQLLSAEAADVTVRTIWRMVCSDARPAGSTQ